jgi:hypothetical protein
MAETMMTLFFGHPGIAFSYRHSCNGRRFSVLHRSRGGTVNPAEIAALGHALRTGLRRIGAS